MDESDGVELAGRELRVDRPVIDRLAPLDLQRLGFLPQRRATSSHLSENAPHMQQSTRCLTRLRIDASITPQAEEVERKTGCLVPNNSCRRG